MSEARYILGFDASTPRCPIVLGRDDGRTHALLEADDELDGANQASARLLLRVRGVLERAGIETRDLGAIACGHGPGTFTGTRVAIASAKGLALGLGVPVIAVGTLAAVAMTAGLEGLVLPLLDARRGEVYGAVHRCTRVHEAPGLERLGDDRCTSIDALLDESGVDDSIVALGPGADVYRDRLRERGPKVIEGVMGPSPEGLWRAIVATARHHADRTAHELEAVYLRQSYAELGLNAPKRPFKRSPFVDP